MKSTLRKWVLESLRFLARRELRRIQPKIVGVTGSAGKTSAKEAMAGVLERRYKVKKSEKNLNTEFGTVLTILGQKTGYSSAYKWLEVLVKSAVKSLREPEDIDVLVLEMGVDTPGDMDEILTVVSPDIMTFLNIKNEHLDEGQFANRQDIFDEKMKACLAVPKDGWVILNTDDNFVSQLVGKLPASVITIGTEEGADLRALDVQTDLDGLKFTLAYEDKELPVHLPNVLGNCHVYIALAAIAVGFICEVPWKAIALGLEEFRLPVGRMNRIDGKNGSLLIDSSYNASPDSMEAALEVLDMFGGPGSRGTRRIAALGTMNELGELTESAHLKVGKIAAEKADMLIAVGKHAKQFAEGARLSGMSTSMIHTFANSKEAGAFLAGALEPRDVVLAKGSQNNVRMEHLVKACMKEPEQARKLLVRQEPYWLAHL